MSGPESLRAAGHALLYWQQRQEVNTHNLANVETPGYRAQRVFAEMLDGGLPSLRTETDPRVGELRQTGAPLDLALGGEGHFVVRTPEGDRLVRSASFSLDGDGRIVDANGHPLLGEGGALILPPGPVEIDIRGGVTVASERVGQILIVREGVGGGAGPEGVTLAAGTIGPDDIADYENVVVRQGYIEGSNVSALDSLVEMTTIQRSFEAVQTSVRMIDSVMDTISNRIGRIE